MMVDHPQRRRDRSCEMYSKLFSCRDSYQACPDCSVTSKTSNASSQESFLDFENPDEGGRTFVRARRGGNGRTPCRLPKTCVKRDGKRRCAETGCESQSHPREESNAVRPSQACRSLRARAASRAGPGATVPRGVPGAASPCFLSGP